MRTSQKKTAGLIAGVIVLILLASPSKASMMAGGIIVCIGETIRMWAAGHLLRKKELTTSGPYAYVRDPLYLGRFFLIVGFCTMGWSYSLILLPAALGIFFLNYLPRKYKKEMAWLEDLFGDSYVRYADYARSLIPRLKPYPAAVKRKWSFDLFWQENREQYFLLIVLSIWSALFLRYKGLS